MEAKVTFTEEEMRAALIEYLKDETGMSLLEWELCIEVKSKQNWKSEWEPAQFRGTLILRR